MLLTVPSPWENSMQVIVMLCWARSGGTLLNRCLASSRETCVLSEVNPRGSAGVDCVGVASQAREWYDIDVASPEFGDAVFEFVSKCHSKNLQVIVRDWTIADFLPPKLPQPNSSTFSTINALDDAGLNVIPFAFVRNAVDVWLSQGAELQTFAAAYLRYAKLLAHFRVPVFRYEDLCRQPEATLKMLCQWSKLRFHKEMLAISTEHRVNGDRALGRASRGYLENSVKVLSRKPATKTQISALHECEDLIEANYLLGYETNYYDTAKESSLTSVLRRIRFRLRSSH